MEEVLVDALPYIDQEYDDPIFREAVRIFIDTVFLNIIIYIPPSH